MEIERKYLVEKIPFNLENFSQLKIAQGYLSTNPVVRIRRSNDEYILTYKGKGLMVREEYNLPLTQEAFEHMIPKCDGRFIEKTRYLIPYMEKYTIELDIFHNDLSPLILAEVEFDSEEDANNFTPPEWFAEDVTYSSKYHNSNLSQV